MANIKIGISSGYKPQNLGNPSRELKVSYLYAYNKDKSTPLNRKFPEISSKKTYD